MPLKCLVLTSFDETGERIKRQLRHALQSEHISFIDPEDLSSDTPLNEGIFQMAHDSDVILADLSENNPNIVFEIGLAIGLGKQVAVLTDERSPIPTSLAQVPVMRFVREEGVTADQVQRLWKSILQRTPRLPTVSREAVVNDLFSSGNAANPFFATSAEHLSPDTLPLTFVRTPAQERLYTPSHTLLVGPRGSGKTTLLQMMRLATCAGRTDVQQNVAGVYINFSSSAHFLGDSEVLEIGKASCRERR